MKQSKQGKQGNPNLTAERARTKAGQPKTEHPKPTTKEGQPEARAPKTVREVMTHSTVTCAADATLQEMCKLMANHDLGFLPLLRDGKLAGVITDRDVAVRAVAQGVKPEEKVGSALYTTDVEVIASGTPIEDAIEHMKERRIRRLVIDDGDDGITGVLGVADIQECCPDKAHELMEEVRKPGTPVG